MGAWTGNAPPSPVAFPVGVKGSVGGVFCARGDVSVTRSRLATVKPYLYLYLYLYCHRPG
mgnify:CR=1 FL=1